MDGSVRQAMPANAEAIGRVHYATHLETYTGKFPGGVIESDPPERRARMWHRIIWEHLGEVWVAEIDGEIVGFASTGPARDDNPPRELEPADPPPAALAAHRLSGDTGVHGTSHRHHHDHRRRDRRHPRGHGTRRDNPRALAGCAPPR